MKTGLILLLFFLSTSCTCALHNKNKDVSKISINQDSPKYALLMKQKYGANSAYYFNQDSSFVLCLEKPTQPVPNNIRFFIYDLHKNEISFEESNAVNSVKWVDANKIRIERIPGMVKALDASSNTSIYYYNVQTKKLKTETTYKP